MASTKPAEMKLSDLSKEELLSLIGELGVVISPKRIARVRWKRLDNEALELMNRSLALGREEGKGKEADDVWKQAETKQRQADKVWDKYLRS